MGPLEEEEEEEEEGGGVSASDRVCDCVRELSAFDGILLLRIW